MDAIQAEDVFALELESELALARDAMLLVATGGARRVVVANLRHGRVIAPPARDLAAEIGVAFGTLPTDDPRRVDFVVLAPGSDAIEAA